jgi:carbonic anhydrase
VHRNIANIVKEDDANCLSVLQFAVEVLAVKHVIVTGHYGCGGVAAALQPTPPEGRLGAWLQSIQEVHLQHIDELSTGNAQANLDRMCELNVLEQTRRLS